MSSLAEQIAEQIESNRSALAHQSAFAPHRRRLTDLIAARAGGRLCLLGAGNCYDLELPRLTQSFSEVHLVDLDLEALERARAAEAPTVRERLTLHELELSGIHGELPSWRAMRVTPEALMAVPSVASKRIAAALPGPFDVVVSACLLSQLQLLLLNVLGERHQLIEAARQIQNLVHLRSIARLLSPGGRGLLVSDVTSNETFDFAKLAPDADLPALVQDLARRGALIYSVNPELLAFTAREDPFLAKSVELSPLRDAWLWQNGPLRTFLVCALELRCRR
jgi:hypothetical protein